MQNEDKKQLFETDVGLKGYFSVLWECYSYDYGGTVMGTLTPIG